MYLAINIKFDCNINRHCWSLCGDERVLPPEAAEGGGAPGAATPPAHLAAAQRALARPAAVVGVAAAPRPGPAPAAGVAVQTPDTRM